MSRAEREHPRYAHEAAVAFTFDGKLFEGRTSNVSRGGFCADLEAKVKVGSEIDVDLVLVFDEATLSEPLRVPSRVVWCTKVDDTYQIGVAFKPMDAERAEYMTMFLRYLGEDSARRRTDAHEPLSIDDRFR